MRETMTLQQIADALNAEGVPTIRGGKLWRPSSVESAAGYKRRKPRRRVAELPAAVPLAAAHISSLQLEGHAIEQRSVVRGMHAPLIVTRRVLGWVLTKDAWA
jgi:hypothetical protein